MQEARVESRRGEVVTVITTDGKGRKQLVVNASMIDEIQFTLSQPNGVFICDTCPPGTEWCEHLELLFKAGHDSELLFNHPGEYSVPMFPTITTMLNTPVSVLPGEEGQPMVRQVDWYSDAFNLKKEYLCHLYRYEGLAVARNVIVDACMARFQEIGEVRCASTSHGYNEDRTFRTHLMVPQKSVAERWSIWRNGACLSCAVFCKVEQDVPGEDTLRKPAYSFRGKNKRMRRDSMPTRSGPEVSGAGYARGGKIVDPKNRDGKRK